MTEDLIIRRPEGVVAIIADNLYHIRLRGEFKAVRKQRETIVTQLESDQSLPVGFPSPNDFSCRVSEIKKVVVHKDGCCDIYSESKHSIKFTSSGQANSLCEHLKSFGTWNQTESRSGFRWHVDATVCLIIGGGLAALSLLFHQGDWADFNESEVGGIRAGRNRAIGGIARMLVSVFGVNVFLWLSIALAILTAGLMLRACKPQETTALERT